MKDIIGRTMVQKDRRGFVNAEYKLVKLVRNNPVNKEFKVLRDGKPTSIKFKLPTWAIKDLLAGKSVKYTKGATGKLEEKKSTQPSTPASPTTTPTSTDTSPYFSINGKWKPRDENYGDRKSPSTSASKALKPAMTQLLYHLLIAD